MNRPDKYPPRNIEAELSVLGSLLLDNETLHDVVPLLKVEDFHRDSHRVIYRAIRDLYDVGKAVDAMNLIDELTRRGDFEKAGGDEAIRKALEETPSAANAKYYARIVKQKAVSRELIEAANEILRDGYSDNFTAEELIHAAERRILAVGEDWAAGGTVDIKDVIVEAMDRTTARAEDRRAVTGMGTGYYDLDEITGGFDAGQLVVLGSRPSMGRSALALNIAEHVACDLKLPVLFVSLQQGHLELTDRLLSSRARVAGHKFRTGKGVTEMDMAQLGWAYTELHSSGLFLDSAPARDGLQIAADARRLKRRHGLALVVVDEIQLVGDGHRDVDQNSRISRASRELKQLAMELNIPVLAPSQLNKGGWQCEDRRPSMEDLRGSGSIIQDADVVLLLHRPEYHDPDDQPGIAELIVAKNRAGATGLVRLAFLKNLTRFENLAGAVDPGRGAF